MKIDLSQFKKIHSNSERTIMRSPDGHEIHLSHSTLEKEKSKALKALKSDKKMAEGGVVAPPPKEPLKTAAEGLKEGFNKATGAEGIKTAIKNVRGYAEGGVVDEEEQYIQPQDYAQPPAIPMESVQAADQMPFVADAQPSVPMQDQIANPSQVFAQPQQAPLDRMPAAAPQDPNMLQQGMNQEIAGLKGQAKAVGALGKEQVAIERQYQADRAHMEKMGQETAQKLNGLLNGAAEAYQKGEVDPSHYWNNKSTVGKISTAIGLILSGVGSGLAHQENLAAKFLQSEIDRDIDAQKANIGKQKNLVDFYEKQLGNHKDAMTMARLTLTDITIHKLNEAAAKSKDPMAMARAQQLSGELQAKHAPALQALQQRQTMLNAAKSGQVDPAQLVPHLVPKERQAEVYKEVKKAQDMAQDIPLLLNLYDQAAKDVGLKNAVGIKAEASQALENAYLKHLKDDVGRVNETELHIASNTFPQALDNLNKDRAEARRRDFVNNLVRGTSAPVAKSYGIDLSRHIPSAESLQSKKIVKDKHGREYYELPGGYMPVKK